MTTYEMMKNISKDDFIEFCEFLYSKGLHDGYDLLDDSPWIRHRMADLEFEYVMDVLR